MSATKTRLCPFCHIEFNWLASHLKHKHNLMSAEERAPHLQISKNVGVKHKDTVLNSKAKNDTLIQFEEQKNILNVEFQDIEDQIVSFYLMTKPKTRSTKDIREKIQIQLYPLYKMVRDSLQVSLFEKNIQLNSDVCPSHTKKLKKFEVTDGDQNIAAETIIDE